MNYKSMFLKSLRFIYVIFVITFGIIFIIASVGDDNGGASNGTSDGTGSSDGQFITTWDTTLVTENPDYGTIYTSASNQIKLPLDPGGIYYFNVDWGDGTKDHITSYDQAETTHTYSAEGIYDITIIGTIEGFGFKWIQPAGVDWGVSGEGNKLLDIKKWGDVKLHNNGYQFNGTSHLSEFSAVDMPSINYITNMSYMFFKSAFNQDISSWDVSIVKDMSYMFCNAGAFNQDISSWDVSSVKDMSYMFCNAGAFNQDISSWDVSSVKDMRGMFYMSVFNQDISLWDVSNVTNMSRMFADARAFNQDISSWDVRNVTDMSRMFADATIFNQDLESWDVNSVTDMHNMFVGSGLEGNEPSWYVP